MPGIVFMQHRGSLSEQQDALWNGHELVQSDDSGVQSLELAGDDILLAVADGVSASRDPRRASRKTLELLNDEFTATIAAATAEWNKTPDDTPKYDAALLNGRHLHRVQDRLGAAMVPRYAGSATTLVMAQLQRTPERMRVRILNVGDSRAARIRVDGRFEWLSRDHTVLQHMLDTGEASPGVEYAQMYKQLMHCIVAERNAEPFSVHLKDFTLALGETLMLCSDGIYEPIEETLSGYFMRGTEPIDQAEAIRAAVLRAGAPDNFSLVLCRPGLP